MCCMWQCQSLKSVTGCRAVRNLQMSEYMKAKQGTVVHKTTYCDRDWENEDTSEEMGERRGEFNSEGVSGEGRGRDKSRRPRQARTRKQRKISNWNQVSWQSAWATEFRKACCFSTCKKEAQECKRERRKKNNWKSPCIWVILFLGGLG